MNLKYLILVAFTALILGGCKKCDDPQPYQDDFTTRQLPVVVTNRNPKTMVKNEQQTATLETLTRVDANGELYRMDYTADYGLDFLIAAGGVKSNTELLGFVQKYLLKVPSKSMTLDNNFGCSSFLVKERTTTSFSAEILITFLNRLSMS